MDEYSPEELGLTVKGSRGFPRISPVEQAQRDGEAERLKAAERNGGAGLVRTSDLIPGSKASPQAEPQEYSPEDLGLRVAGQRPSKASEALQSVKNTFGEPLQGPDGRSPLDSERSAFAREPTPRRDFNTTPGGAATSFIAPKGKVERPTTRALEQIPGMAAQLSDMTTSVGKQLLGAGVYWGARIATRNEPESAEAAQAAKDYFFPPEISTPWAKVAESLGPQAKRAYYNNPVAWVFGKIGEAVEHGATAVEKQDTTGRLKKGDISALVDQFMGSVLAKGLKKSVVDRWEKQRQAEKRTLEGEVLPPEDYYRPRLSAPEARTFDNEATVAPDGSPGGGLQKLLKTPEGVEKLAPEARQQVKAEAAKQSETLQGQMGQLRQNLEELQTMSGKGSSAKTQEAAKAVETAEARKNQWDAIAAVADGLPDWTKALGVGAGAYVGAKLSGQDAMDSLLLGAAALAVKGKGGMWHPKAREVLSDALMGDHVATGYLRGPAVHLDRHLAQGDIGQKDVDMHAWNEKASQSYLNKHMGTETDPLRDVEIPFGEGTKKWGEVTDALVKGPTVREIDQAGYFNDLGLPPDAREKLAHERIWSINEGRQDGVWSERSEDAKALKSYLSHVGDFLRQNVPVDKLPQYDLVRAVKETAQNDAKIAKQMEKEAAQASKDLPVHKEYPDGYRWVELKLPEKLTEEQRKAVIPADQIDWPGDTPPDPEFTHVAVDTAGKPIKNNYTEDLAFGKSPEEAWLAGQLAREGNQMGHCVGGYCEEVSGGASRIFSLRDPKGRSHVTIETQPANPAVYDAHRFYDEGSPSAELLGELQGIREEGKEYHADVKDAQRRYILGSDEYHTWLKAQPDDIVQIKGKQNRAPVKEYQKYAQDFVKSGKWGEVGDLENTGLHNIGTRSGSLYPKGLPDEALRIPPRELMAKLGGEGYYTKEEISKAADEILGKGPKGEQGSADPKLLLALGFGLAGAAAGAYFNDKNPLWGAIVGATLGVAGPRMLKRSLPLADELLGVVSTRVGNISEPLKMRMRRFDHLTLREIHKNIEKGAPFLFELNKKLGKQEKLAVEQALLQNDPHVTRQTLRTVGNQHLTNAWNQMNQTIQTLQASSGVDYFPRIIEDLDALKKGVGPQYAKAIDDLLLTANKQSVQRRQHGLSNVEQSKVIDKFLMSRQPLQGLPGFANGRTTAQVIGQLQSFYVSPAEVYHSFVKQAIERIETERFFGSHYKPRLSDAVDSLVSHAVANSRMTGAQGEELRNLLTARFSPMEAPSGPIRVFKNLSYAGLLGNVVSAATQLGDIGTSVYVNGMKPTIYAVAEKLIGGSKLRAKDFGLADHLSEEFVNQDRTARFLNKTFRATLFQGVDMFGKNIALNSTMKKYGPMARTAKGQAKIHAEFDGSFGVPHTTQLIADLQRGVRTDLTELLAFSKLADMQPITRSEVPEAYLKNPNARIFYMLKTFMLKQLDIARRDGYNEIKKGNRAKGVKNLTALALTLGISGATAGMVQDFLMGREVSFDVMENVFKTFGWSEYMTSKAKKEGFFATVAGMAGPPFKMWDQIVKGDPKAVQYIPLVGKLIYNHMMGGAKKADEQKHKREKKKREGK